MTNEAKARWLRAELPGLVREGVIDEAAAERLRARYPAPAGRGLRVQAILSTLGALLVGTGVILFFAANWDGIPRLVRTAAVLAAIAGAYFAAWRLCWRPGRHPAIGEAILLLGGLLFGAGIWLVAQIFNLSEHQPNGALLWGVGVLPLAWAARSRALAVLSLATLTLYVLWETGETGDPAWRWAFAYAPALALAYALRARAVVAVGLVGLLAGAGTFVAVAVEEQSLFLAPAAGALLWLGALAHEEAGPFWRPHAPAWRFVAAIAALSSLLPLTFGDLVKELLPEAREPGWWLGAVITAAVAAALAGLLAARPRAPGEARSEAHAQLGAVAALALFAAGSSLALRGAATFVTVAQNLAMLAATSGLVVLAVRRGWRAVQWLGLAAFAALVLSRYFDLFFDLMPRSLFFIGVGGLLIAGVYVAARLRRREGAVQA